MLKRELKERPIGNVFIFEGTKLRVVKSTSSECDGCFLKDNNRCIPSNSDLVGVCHKDDRKDKTNVIFIKIEG